MNRCAWLLVAALVLAGCGDRTDSADPSAVVGGCQRLLSVERQVAESGGAVRVDFALRPAGQDLDPADMGWMVNVILGDGTQFLFSDNLPRGVARRSDGEFPAGLWVVVSPSRGRRFDQAVESPSSGPPTSWDESLLEPPDDVIDLNGFALAACRRSPSPEGLAPMFAIPDKFPDGEMMVIDARVLSEAEAKRYESSLPAS